ncbi:30S ribosomal protein S16 [Candidatus Dojkabacteria bacterium]|uniref:Small ribosomal subunit protein bS16 n=1 Tax=Candidatus Dojkabacteria bacterium TaxID=2099670 RepID=A0A955HZB0_9BACT|nr:30S ribosomal protein S16 [Candidatus Dojkabacteria bacterium]
MLKIRLKRTGRKGQPHYRIVIAEANRSRNSKSVEEIGYYNPRTQPSTVEIDQEAARKWLRNGAQPTNTVAQLFVKAGIIKDIKRGSTKPSLKPKKKAAKEESESK